MLAKIRTAIPVLAAIVAISGVGLFPGAASAQFFNDAGQSDGFVESDDQFFEDADRQGGISPAPRQQADDRFTDSGGFIDEDRGGVELPTPGRVTIDRRRTQIRIQGERDLLPLNTAWGAGTGLLIGSWFAIIQNGTDRETQRFIGMGVVLGAGLGVALGLKTLINPSAPSAAMADPPKSEPGISAQPLVTLATGAGSPFRIGLTLRF